MKDNGFDFTECRFINDEMKFYSYEDFVQNCEAIKRLYEKVLTKNGKIFYKWYVYASIHLTMNSKNRIWEYLNGYLDKKVLYQFMKKI